MCLADNSQEMLGFFLLFFCLFVFLLLSFSFFFKKIRLDISSELSAEMASLIFLEKQNNVICYNFEWYFKI